MKRGIGRHLYLAFCVAVFVFLIAPILVIVPLSFNAQPYFTFTEEMLRLDADAWSLRWYRSVAEDEEWRRALVNSIVIGVCATALATVLGTLAALGLANPAMYGRSIVMTLLISPMVTPVIVSAAGMFFLLFEPRARTDPPRTDPCPRCAGYAVRGDHGNGDTGGLRRELDARRCQPGSGSMAEFLARAVSAHRDGSDFRGTIRVRNVVRRGSNGAVHRRPGAAHHPAPDVGRRPRANQSRHPRGRNPPDRFRTVFHADRGVATPTKRKGLAGLIADLHSNGNVCRTRILVSGGR